MHKSPISPQQLNYFQTHGFVKLSNVATEQELLNFRTHFREGVMKVVGKGDQQNRIDDYSTIFTQVTNMWQVHPQTKDFILSRRFADLASQLLAVSKVRLYHDQALVKDPSAGKTPWHQDYFYWPIDSPKVVTMWLPLQRCPRTRGTMQFVKGSHMHKGLKPMPISEASETYYQNFIESQHLEVQTFDLEVGEVTFHLGRTLHCAHPNTEGLKREVMTIIYMEDGAQAVQPDQLNSFREVDLKVFCPQVQCGQVIESALNPLLN